MINIFTGGIIMTTSANTHIGYAPTGYTEEDTIWRRLIHSIFSSDEVVVHTPGYIPFERTRKETTAFNPYEPKVAYDLLRIV